MARPRQSYMRMVLRKRRAWPVIFTPTVMRLGCGMIMRLLIPAEGSWILLSAKLGVLNLAAEAAELSSITPDQKILGDRDYQYGSLSCMRCQSGRRKACCASNWNWKTRLAVALTDVVLKSNAGAESYSYAIVASYGSRRKTPSMHS